jgi:hypothetical protein
MTLRMHRIWTGWLSLGLLLALTETAPAQSTTPSEAELLRQGPAALA